MSITEATVFEKKEIRRVRFNSQYMFKNTHQGNSSKQKKKNDDGTSAERAEEAHVLEELQRIQRENNHLRKKLSRRWSSKSKMSLDSKVMIAQISEDESNEEDDSWILLKENSTLHGFRDLFLSSSIKLKFVWVVILVIAALLTSHGVLQIWLEFTMRRVVVSYFSREASTLALPDISICPFNRFNKSYFTEWNVSSSLAQYLELTYSTPLIHDFQDRLFQETVNNIDYLDYELEELLGRIGSMTFTAFLNKATLGCEAFFPDTTRCENLTEIMTSTGKCFRLSGTNQSVDGFGYGDRIVIKLPQDLYTPGANQFLNDGVIVKLSEKGKGIDNDLTFIPAGVHAIMPLSAFQYEFMNDPPEYECQVDPTGKYSRVYCIETCYVGKAEEKCNCSLAAATIKSKDTICTAKQIYHCILLAFEESMESCRTRCKSPCSYFQYQKQISYATFPGQMARHFVNDSDFENLKLTIVLEVYYNSLDYTVIKHIVAMPLQSVIAQIGGQFSLWTGCSLISILQFFIYFTRWIAHKLFARFKKKGRRRYEAKIKLHIENGDPYDHKTEDKVESNAKL